MPSTPLDSFHPDRPLAESIAIATKSIHSRLNKLIIERLPLALPPHASDPFDYASGMLHIAPIYTTFESLWHDIVDASIEHDHHDVLNALKPSKPIVSEGLRKLLAKLHVPGLMRADQLVTDIQSMTGWTEAVTREQLTIVRKTGHLAEFANHIERAINNKPHVLLSYSYIMYMALFAGGRYIRATLESADNEFWDTTVSIAPISRPGEETGRKNPAEGMAKKQTEPSPRCSHGSLPLRFFHFNTIEDGEDLKQDFKQKFKDGEEMLSYQEKYDIVQEAICIFENMILLVAQLDHVTAAGRAKPSADSPASVDSAAAVINKPLVPPRFRDSVVVTKERSARGSSNRMSGTSWSSGDSKDEAAHTPKETLPYEPTNNATIPSTTGIELCPGLPKSMRFEKTLPHPPRSHLSGVGSSTAGLTESLKVASERSRREQVRNWVLGVAVGIIMVGVLFSSRRAASLGVDK